MPTNAPTFASVQVGLLVEVNVVMQQQLCWLGHSTSSKPKANQPVRVQACDFYCSNDSLAIPIRPACLVVTKGWIQTESRQWQPHLSFCPSSQTSQMLHKHVAVGLLCLRVSPFYIQDRTRKWSKKVLIKNGRFMLHLQIRFLSTKQLSITSWDMTNRLLSIITTHLATVFLSGSVFADRLEHSVIPTRTQADSKDLDLEHWVKSARSWPCHNLSFGQHTVSITRPRSAPQRAAGDTAPFPAHNAPPGPRGNC